MRNAIIKSNCYSNAFLPSSSSSFLLLERGWKRADRRTRRSNYSVEVLRPWWLTTLKGSHGMPMPIRKIFKLVVNGHIGGRSKEGFTPGTVLMRSEIRPNTKLNFISHWRVHFLFLHSSYFCRVTPENEPVFFCFLLLFWICNLRLPNFFPFFTLIVMMVIS